MLQSSQEWNLVSYSLLWRLLQMRATLKLEVQGTESYPLMFYKGKFRPGEEMLLPQDVDFVEQSPKQKLGLLGVYGSCTLLTMRLEGFQSWIKPANPWSPQQALTVSAMGSFCPGRVELICCPWVTLHLAWSETECRLFLSWLSAEAHLVVLAGEIWHE